MFKVSRVVITPLADWDRYPAYTRRVDLLPTEAYILHDGRQPDKAAALARRLSSERRPFAVHRFGPYQVFTSPRHERLLPLVGHAWPLPEPRAANAVEVAAGPHR